MVGFTWKLKHLKTALRIWNREVFGDIFIAILDAKDKVRYFEIAYESSQSMEDREYLHLAQAELFGKLRVEETFCKQNARYKCQEESDLYPEFFPTSLVNCRANLTIRRIKYAARDWLEDFLNIYLDLQLLHAFSSYDGNYSNVAVVLFALRDGLEVCLHKCFLCTIIESDSLLICNLVHGQVCLPWKLDALVHGIQH
ncbi:hypothetical protein ACH5RR_037204 [Cinchona calisaya]|uniref:RNase H type-1 domain-containing protein n=1 Tax=Cinchona calisaya TaxID=153742 RepID=A0ABD2Y978_9GENT